MVTGAVRCRVVATSLQREASSPAPRGARAPQICVVDAPYESLQLMLLDLQYVEFRNTADPHFPAEYPGLPNRDGRMVCLPTIVFVLVCEFPF